MKRGWKKFKKNLSIALLPFFLQFFARFLYATNKKRFHYPVKMDDENFYTEQTEIEYVIFNGFSEISKSFDNLKLIEKFVHINPPQEDEINYANYLTYHIHNYLQEMYISKDRLDTYIKTINEQYKKQIVEKLLEGTPISV